MEQNLQTRELTGYSLARPPLEALRFPAREAATLDDSGSSEVGASEEKVIMINDVARASFEAKATRKICVELPEECAEAL